MSVEAAFENMTMKRQVDALTLGLTPIDMSMGPYMNPPPRPKIYPTKPDMKPVLSMKGRFYLLTNISLL